MRQVENSGIGRVGRSYPRLPAEEFAEPEPASGYRVTGALLALFAALGLIGWFLAR